MVTWLLLPCPARAADIADSAITAAPTATAPKPVFLFMIVTSSRSAPGIGPPERMTARSSPPPDTFVSFFAAAAAPGRPPNNCTALDCSDEQDGSDHRQDNVAVDLNA